MKKYNVFVFTLLKPSQIYYKIVPLSMSTMVEHVYVLRKQPIDIKENKITCLSLPWFVRIRPFYWFLAAFYGIYYMYKYKANIILNYNIFPHGFNAYIASKITGKPAIFSEINEDTKKYYQYTIPRFLIHSILKNATAICVPGRETASFWSSRGFTNIHSLHSTIDIEKFKPDLSYKKIYDFIFVGVFDKNKRPDLIIEAFAELCKTNPSARLCIIGFGPLEVVLKNQVKQFGLQDNITILTTKDVLGYFRQSKIFIMASLTEGLPCAMMEAMATGLIVLVPPVGDIGDVVKHQSNGFLHDNSKEHLALLMKETLDNYKNLESVQKNARETIINNHSYTVATEKWNYLLKAIR